MTGISVGGRRPCIKSTFLAAGDGMAGWRSSPRQKDSGHVFGWQRRLQVCCGHVWQTCVGSSCSRLQRNKHVAVADVGRFRFGHEYSHSCHALNQHSQRFWCGISPARSPRAYILRSGCEAEGNRSFPVTRHGSLAIPVTTALSTPESITALSFS